MLGRYDNFPDNYHGEASVLHEMELKELQKALLSTLHKLNMERENIQASSLPNLGCKVKFDFGIADGLTFNYIDEEVMRYLLKVLEKKEICNIDILCIIRYYKERDGRDIPLRFDYYILRFIFKDGSVDVLVFHEKGTRRLSVEDIINFLIEAVNINISKDGHPKLRLRGIR